MQSARCSTSIACRGIEWSVRESEIPPQWYCSCSPLLLISRGTHVVCNLNSTQKLFLAKAEIFVDFADVFSESLDLQSTSSVHALGLPTRTFSFVKHTWRAAAPVFRRPRSGTEALGFRMCIDHLMGARIIMQGTKDISHSHTA